MSRYQRRVSGPLLDRIDLFIDVPRVEYENLVSTTKGEPSSAVAARVQAAREVQHVRFSDRPTRTMLNAEMSPSEVRDHAQVQLVDGADSLLRTAVEQLGLSARAFHRVLKVARTIADLTASDHIEPAHVAEAVQYRERTE